MLDLHTILPPETLSFDEATRADLSHDCLLVRGVPDHAATPAAVVRPRHVADVAALLRAATEHGFPVVPRGAGTGLMGGALPLSSDAVVLDLRSLDAIEVDRPDRRVRAGAGAVIRAVERACRAEGLTLGHDPWTQGVATVGGSLGANGLGYRGARFGCMADLVLGVEAVTAAGEVVRTPPASFASGLSIPRLAAGTEGTLLVVTEVVLRARPRPEARRILAVRFKTFERGLEAMNALVDAGLEPAIFEYREHFAAPDVDLGEDEPPTAYVGFEGPRPVVRAATRLARRLLRRLDGKDLGRRAAREFWATRHELGDRVGQGEKAPLEGGKPGCAFDFMHVEVAPSRVRVLDGAARELLAGEGLHLVERGTFARPGLYALTLFDPATGGPDPGRLVRFREAFLGVAAALDGSLEAIHGIGTYLAGDVARHAPAAAAIAARVKAALDPRGILNPGKGPSPLAR